MPDYQNGKIYKIYCNITEEVYYGSTTVPLCKRVAGHRTAYKQWIEGKKKYCKSFDILGRGDYSYSLVEDCPCERKENLLVRERYYIQNNHCVNKDVPEKNKEVLAEKKKEYYEKNKEVIAEKKKEGYEKNKEVIVEYRKEYYEKNKEVLLGRQKEYNEKNKVGVAEKKKEWYEKNKEVILEKNKERIRCECCNCEMANSSWLQHTKTKKHQKNSK